MTENQLHKELVKAYKRVEKLDQVDGVEDRELGTIIAALKAGLVDPSTGAQFEGLAMLIDLNSKVQRRKAAIKNN